MFTKKNDKVSEVISAADLQKLINEHSDYIKLIFSLTPPELGGALFAVNLEYTYFPPNTPKNDEFGMITSQAGDSKYTILFVPSSAKSIVDKVAADCKLKQSPCDLSDICYELSGTAIRLTTTVECGHHMYIQLLREELEKTSAFVKTSTGQQNTLDQIKQLDY